MALIKFIHATSILALLVLFEIMALTNWIQPANEFLFWSLNLSVIVVLAVISPAIWMD